MSGVGRRRYAVVESAVRRGVASSRLLPLSLIILETTGFKSGKAPLPGFAYAVLLTG